ncbi:MAG: GNAT family N-acetyltransferase [Lachnospiraceae bacterium]|nr:GNAT family N-acetyltransferase [Lachnospiraceae bacterium]
MTISTLAKEQKDLLTDIVPADLLTDEYIAICAINKEQIMGCLILSMPSARICDIPFIYVVPAARKRKTARKMLEYAASIARAEGVSGISMNYIEEAEDDLLTVFSKAVGFIEVNSSNLYEAGLAEALDSVSNARPMKKLPPAVSTPIAEMTNRMWNELRDEIDALKASADENDVYDIPYPKDYYDGNLSFIARDVAGIPWGLVLCRDLGDCINIEYLCSLKPKAHLAAPVLLRELSQRLSGREETTIRFHAYNPKIDKLVSMSLGESAKVAGRFASVLYHV